MCVSDFKGTIEPDNLLTYQTGDFAATVVSGRKGDRQRFKHYEDYRG